MKSRRKYFCGFFYAFNTANILVAVAVCSPFYEMCIVIDG